MRKFIDDMFNLVRLRVYTLDNYQYPFWQPALVLTLLGLVSAAGAEGFTANLGVRIAFFVLLNWVETLLFVGFLSWWLKRVGWKPPLPLFALVVMSNAPQLLSPLTSWLPESIAQLILLLLALLCVVILVHALSSISRLPRLRILLGMVLFTPLAFVILLVLLQVAQSNHWLAMENNAARDKNIAQGVDTP